MSTAPIAPTTAPTTTGGTPAAAPGAAAQPSATPTPIAAVPSGGGTTTETINPGSWRAGFSEDLKGYVDNKGFKDPAALAEAYRNFEKLQGVPQDRVMKLPEKFYDDKGKLTNEGREIYERLGAPKDAKEYNLTAPKEGGDPKLLEHFRSVFHEAGIPKSAAEKIVGAWNEYQGQISTVAKEAMAQAFKDQQAMLTKEWGMAHEQNVNVAKEAVRTMGISSQQVDALSAVLGHAETMKFFHKLGTQVREAPFVGGSQPNKMLEPANAQARIAELRSDRSFGERLMKGDSEAKTMWESLHKQAYPGQFSL